MSTFEHDPNAVLDYLWDWSTYLDGDTISSHQIVVDPVDGVTKDSSINDDTTVTAWISGGTAGTEVKVTCRIITTQGRTDDRTILLIIKDR